MDDRMEKRIPRMRTAPKIVAEIKALDPGSEVTEHYIRQLVKKGFVAVAWAGSKALINLDDVLDILWAGTERPEPPPPPTVQGIRRLPEFISTKDIERGGYSGERR